MKKVKFAFAALAVFTAVATMSFTTTNETKVQTDDCWSTEQRIDENLPADVDQTVECPGNDGNCCYKPISETENESFSPEAM